MRLFLVLIFFITLQANEINNFNNKEEYKASINFEERGLYLNAAKALLPLYNSFPKDYFLNLRLGWLFFKSKKYADAKNYYQKASLIKPKSFEPKYGLIKIALIQYDFKKAQKIAYQILAIDPLNYYGNLYFIDALIGAKKYQLAYKTLTKMLTYYPTSLPFINRFKKVQKEILKKDNVGYLFEIIK